MKLDRSWKPLNVKSGSHRCFENEDNEIIKIPRYNNSVSLEDALESLSIYKDHFQKFIPETVIKESNNFNYEIYQRKINGEVLRNINVDSLSKECLQQIDELMTNIISFISSFSNSVDLIGFQGISKEENINFVQKMFRSLKLSYLNGNILESTNVMVENDAVFFVDCVHPVPISKDAPSVLHTVFWKLKDVFMLARIKKVKSEIKKVIRERDFDYENIFSGARERI